MFQTKIAGKVKTYFMFDSIIAKGVSYMGKCGKMW